jgi:hypothetical protein
MTNPTSNFGWQMPTSTDLVTDLPADFEVFGQAVDTDFVDLLGGTTGQVLSKTSATDLDFTWINNDTGDITGVTAGTGITGGGTSGTVTVTNDMATTITAAGDIVVGTGSGTYDNLPIGTTAQVLTADTTVSPYKVKWAAASAGAMTLISTTTLAATANTITFSSISSAYQHLHIVYSCKGANDYIKMTFNNITTSTYYGQYNLAFGTTNAAAEQIGTAHMRIGLLDAVVTFGVIDIPDYKGTTLKKSMVAATGSRANSSSAGMDSYTFIGSNDSTDAINRVDINCDSAFQIGSVFSLYGVS